MESPVAKATYVKTQGMWKVYWMRADLKWHGYAPAPKVQTVDAFSRPGGARQTCVFFRVAEDAVEQG
ncbi:MAG TPA: DUF3024 domain-containing protein [Thiobacillaceae bacterium]|nr:DUF3024 domain-containing protein [Thiobacillaceae bacterium]